MKLLTLTCALFFLHSSLMASDALTPKKNQWGQTRLVFKELTPLQMLILVQYYYFESELLTGNRPSLIAIFSLVLAIRSTSSCSEIRNK